MEDIQEDGVETGMPKHVWEEPISPKELAKHLVDIDDGRFRDLITGSLKLIAIKIKKTRQKETNKINALFNKAIRGIKIGGKTNLVIAKKLEKLSKKKDFDILVGLLEILSFLAESKDVTFINNEAYAPVTEISQNDRLSTVFKYVKETEH